MHKKKLKDWVIPSLSLFVLIGGIFCYYMITNIINYQVTNGNFYVTDALIRETMDVNNEKKSIILPYTSDKVSTSKYYYEKEADAERQESSLIKYDKIYMPNTGMLYDSDEEFDVVSILDGKVTQVKEDEILGYIVEIEHEDKMISVYQSIKDVTVKVGDIVTQGQPIAKSGSNNLSDTKENNLHFEVYKNGTLINPEELFL